MIVAEYDERDELVDVFEVEQGDVVGSWLRHTNKRINQLVNQVNADCVLDYWSHKDPSYVNGMAPMMCYVDCEHHGPQIGSRAVYPHPGVDTQGYCPECGDDLAYAFQQRLLSEKLLVTLPQPEKDQILTRCRTERAALAAKNVER